MNGTLPLSGVRVLDLSRMIAQNPHQETAR
jgi:hypothetical protein